MDNLQVTLQIGGLDTRYDVHPIFDDKTKVKITKEDNQIFHREVIDGTFKFVGEDFDLINSCDATTLFALSLYREGSFMGKGTFRKVDCTMNYDDKICTIRLKTSDRYNKILSRYDDKYNLIKLAPYRESVVLERRGVLQLYVRGEKVLTNMIGGMYYEQDCIEEYDFQKLLRDYHFSFILPLSYIIIDNSTELINGEYSVDKDASSSNRWIYRHIISGQIDQRYVIILRQYVDVNGNIYYTAFLNDTYSGDYLAHSDALYVLSDDSKWNFMSSDPEGEVHDFDATFYDNGDLFGRYLCPSRGGDEYVVQRPTEDICEYDMNYPYVRPSSYGGIGERLAFVREKSDTPTPWGIDSDMKYFTEPTLTDEQKRNGDYAIPIGQSHWATFSSWIIYDKTLKDIPEVFNIDFFLNDAYTLWSAIEVLLKEVDESIVFDKDVFSDFLNPRNEDAYRHIYPFLGYRMHIPYITPITNVKKTYYEQAAQRGDITLKQIFDMLRKVYQCYWWIDDNNKLRIEHISYFKNGNTYKEGGIQPTIDVTNMVDLPNRKKWSFCTNEITYDVSKSPSRYEFEWGDKCSAPFNGTPIDIKDEYLTSSRKESIKVEGFVADVDFAMLFPSELDNDLFCLMETYPSGGRLPIVDIRLGDDTPKYRMQNGYLSFINIEKSYYPFDLGGWLAYADDVRLEVNGVSNVKKQTINFPCLLSYIDADGVVRTGIGDGMIDNMEVSADTLMAKVDARFPMERYYLDKVYPHIDIYDNTRLGMIRNDSDRDLEVTYAVFNEENNKISRSISSVKISIGMEVEVFSVPIYNRAGIKIFNAVDVTLVNIGRFFSKDGGMMTHEITHEISSPLKITFKGNYGNEADYDVTNITARKDVLVTIVGETLLGDYGWANPFPMTNAIDAADALYKVSGRDEVSFRLNKGESMYIGYSKQINPYQSPDIVYFKIEEI